MYGLTAVGVAISHAGGEGRAGSGPGRAGGRAPRAWVPQLTAAVRPPTAAFGLDAPPANTR